MFSGGIERDRDIKWVNQYGNISPGNTNQMIIGSTVIHNLGQSIKKGTK